MVCLNQPFAQMIVVMMNIAVSMGHPLSLVYTSQG